MDLNKPVILTDIEFEWSDDFWKCGVWMDFNGRPDTFDDWTLENWRDFIKLLYGRENVFGIVLLFKQGDHEFTTFRAYDYRKHDYYSKAARAEEPAQFWIKINEPGKGKGRQTKLGVPA